MCDASMHPVGCREFDAEVLILYHSTTISGKTNKHKDNKNKHKCKHKQTSKSNANENKQT